MLRLYLVRHGHTLWNDTGGVAGRTDIDLSEAGRLAVSELAQSLPADSTVNSWYSSPLTRTRDTTRLLREGVTINEAMPGTTFDERLVELDFGDWEGMTWQTVHEQYQKEMDLWGQDWINRAPPNGERFSQQAKRCADFLHTMVSVDQTEHTAMVVSHGGSIRALVCLCLGWPLTRAMSFTIDPATVTTLDLHRQSGQWTLRKLNSLRF